MRCGGGAGWGRMPLSFALGLDCALTGGRLAECGWGWGCCAPDSSGMATGFLLPWLPTLYALRGGVVGVFQRLAGMASTSYPCKETDLFFWQPAVGLDVDSAGWRSGLVSVAGRAVPPRSGRLLGRSLEKNSVTDSERFFGLAALKTGTLSTRRTGETAGPFEIWVCRRGNDRRLVSRRAPPAVTEAMVALLSWAR